MSKNQSICYLVIPHNTFALPFTIIKNTTCSFTVSKTAYTISFSTIFQSRNNTEFIGCSIQVVEDCCEVFVICRCNFDPTEQNTDHRYEDVMGSLDHDNLMVALSCWNRALADTAATS